MAPAVYEHDEVTHPVTTVRPLGSVRPVGVGDGDNEGFKLLVGSRYIHPVAVAAPAAHDSRTDRVSRPVFSGFFTSCVKRLASWRMSELQDLGIS